MACLSASVSCSLILSNTDLYDMEPAPGYAYSVVWWILGTSYSLLSLSVPALF